MTSNSTINSADNSLDNNYNPQNIENKWQKFWHEHKIANPNFNEKAENFCIHLPPPNVTGTLHMGHAFNQTIMDTLARHARMSGKNTLWVPGTDHAGIATQIVVERQLEKQGMQRKNMERQEFIDKVWNWKEQSGTQIIEQIKRLGASISWEYEYFTMDDKMSNAVIEVFVRLYQDGLIYQGNRLVNWDPKLQTAVSDLEVASHEEQGSIWNIAYPLADDESVKLIVATTRPETLFGDVAVMVNPQDERYQNLIGKYVKLPLTNRLIPIIADEYVDINFGTGAVKVTPAHDFNDYEVAKRHSLPYINIFDKEAKCNENVPTEFSGLERFTARAKVIEELQKINLLIKQQAHILMVPRCERTGEIIEPLLTRQWFVDLTKTKQENGKDGGLTAITLPALHAVQNKQIEIIPTQWKQTYEHWLNNIQDWCISRQLWWGHQIPAWYTEDNSQVFVAKTKNEAIQQAKNSGYLGELKQDEDVLDTWFSSALIPFSSLGWPHDTKEIKHFLPSSVLVTGYDIIFFWVARMVMMTKYFTGKNPFNTVYVHGLIRDADGKKMSKSEGNTLDPVDLIDGISLDNLLNKRTQGLRRPETAAQVIAKTKQTFPEGIPAFGTDAIRFTFASLASLGRSINFDTARCSGYRNFCNKLWNAARFALMNVTGKAYTTNSSEIIQSLSFADIWILNKLQAAALELEQHFKTYRLDLATAVLYKLVWEEYCDWYVELAKVQINQGNEEQAKTTRYILVFILEQILCLIHPIMPFITEELWQKIAPFLNKSGSISIQNYPNKIALLELINNCENSKNKQNKQEQAINYIQIMQNIIHSCRNLRSEMNIAPHNKIELEIAANDNNLNTVLNILEPYIKSLAKISNISIYNELQPSALPSVMLANLSLRFNLPLDIEAEKARLEKELAKINVEIQKCSSKLNNSAFIDKAPDNIVKQEKERLQNFNNTYEKIKRQLEII